MFRSGGAGSQKGGWVCVFSAVQERNEAETMRCHYSADGK